MSLLVQFEYQYRDADNYKKSRLLQFKNELDRSIKFIDQEIRKTLLDGIWFVADQVQLPELFLYEESKVTVADHCLHELVVVQAFIGEAKPEEIAGSIDCLIARFVEAENRGWVLFDPNVRLA